jgi:hypothetical protein
MIKLFQRMPILNAMAKKFLAVPASSASSERAFSKLALTDTDPRNRLDPETVCNLISFQSVLSHQSKQTVESLHTKSKSKTQIFRTMANRRESASMNETKNTHICRMIICLHRE